MHMPAKKGCRLVYMAGLARMPPLLLSLGRNAEQPKHADLLHAILLKCECLTLTCPFDRCCAYHREATARSEGGYCRQSVVAWPAKVSQVKKISAASESTRLSVLCSLLYFRANEKGSPLAKSKAKAYRSALSANSTRSCSVGKPAVDYGSTDDLHFSAGLPAL